MRTSRKLRPAICNLNICTCKWKISSMPPAPSMFPRLRKTPMIPSIRDAGHARFSRPRPFVFWCGGKYSFARILLLLIMEVCLIRAAGLQASEESNGKTVPVPAAQQPPAGSNSSARAGIESTPLQKAVHQRKVITEDDLARPAKAVSLSDLDGEENNPVCDLS